MDTYPLRTAKDKLSSLLDQVERTHERVTITRNGHAAGVLLSPEDLAALEETLDLLSDPAALARIATARGEVARGEGLDAAALRDFLAAPAE